MPWPQVWRVPTATAPESEPARRAALRSAGWVTGVTGVTRLMASAFWGCRNPAGPSRLELPAVVGPGTFALATVTAIGLTARNRRMRAAMSFRSQGIHFPCRQAAAYEQRQTEVRGSRRPWRGLWPGSGSVSGVARGLRRIRLADGIAHLVKRTSPSMSRRQLAFRSLGIWSRPDRRVWNIVNRQADAGGAIEAAYSKQPTMLTVSGGPGSQIPFGLVSREGRRIVNMAPPAAEITAVTGKPAMDPVRAFAGIATATQVDELGGLRD